ncbi:MAG: arginine--tRNA ligase [Chthonomonadetes bacterium]|nr:arginine--tRNA ligase [Chthonomonadetes bacterium]
MAKERVVALLEQALQKAKEAGDLPITQMPEITVEPPRVKEFGDFASNVAMLLTRELKKPPQQIAATIVKHLPEDPLVSKVEVAGNGFINFTLHPDWLYDVLRDIQQKGDAYGRWNVGQGKRVNVEFVSANPNGPITVAHGRGGAIGDVLANLLEAVGYQVTREFYVNDATNSLQMQHFARSLVVRYRQLLGEDVELPEDGYAGEYLVDIARDLLEKEGKHLAEGDEDTVIERFRAYAEDAMKRQQQQDLADFGIVFDVWFSENSLHTGGQVAQAIEELKARGYAYEHDGALWLRSTAFGDDKDRVLVRNNGQPTYIAADAAYHKNKFERGFDYLIDIWGPDHHGYVARTKAAVAALGYPVENFEVLIYQIVRLFKGGDLVRMSKRAGNVVTLRDVLEEVGKDAARFFFLMRSHDSPLDFDLELAKKESSENPVYYVQYAHARICSILRVAGEQGWTVPAAAETDLSVLREEQELALMKKLDEFPEEVLTSATERAPHRLTRYSMEVADAFHKFYDTCRVVSDDRSLTQARLVLVDATRIVLKNVLGLLGVTAPERM